MTLSDPFLALCPIRSPSFRAAIPILTNVFTALLECWGMDELPFVTLAMPSYNEELYIEACLRSLLDQSYPRDRMEILVTDGGSQDKTREIVARIATADSRIRLLDNSKHRLQSYGKNLAIQEAKGEFILIADVHAEYRNDYIEQLVNTFLRTGADSAGGLSEPRRKHLFRRRSVRP